MTGQAAPIADPCACSGPFRDLMTEIRACKERRTCPSLISRRYYFEPNSATAEQWQEERVYLSGIDPRVVFVCESPGPQIPSKDDAEPLRCWAEGGWNTRFRRAREKHELMDYYITNTVKCGGVRRRHTEHELASCRHFLVRELELIEPLVVVGVGGAAYRALRKDIVPCLRCKPVCFQITHYSARVNVGSRWEREFAGLKRLLERLKPKSEW